MSESQIMSPAPGEWEMFPVKIVDHVNGKKALSANVDLVLFLLTHEILLVLSETSLRYEPRGRLEKGMKCNIMACLCCLNTEYQLSRRSL